MNGRHPDSQRCEGFSTTGAGDGGSVAPADGSTRFQTALRRHLMTYGILEGAAMACAFALFLVPDLLPLAAALVPMGTMVLRFPRSS